MARSAPFRLTAKFCEAAKPDRDARDESIEVTYRDLQTPALALRMLKWGARTWSYRYSTFRSATAKLVRMALGAYPAVTLDAARKKASEIAGKVDRSADPAIEAEELRQPTTFKTIAERMLAEHPTLADPTRSSYRYTLIRHVDPAIGDIPAAAVRRDDIHRLLKAAEESGKANGGANREVADFAKAAIGSAYKFARKMNLFGDAVVIIQPWGWVADPKTTKCAPLCRLGPITSRRWYRHPLNMGAS